MLPRPAPDEVTHPLHVAHQAAVIGGAVGTCLILVLPKGPAARDYKPSFLSNSLHAISRSRRCLLVVNSIENRSYAKAYHVPNQPI